MALLDESDISDLSSDDDDDVELSSDDAPDDEEDTQVDTDTSDDELELTSVSAWNKTQFTPKYSFDPVTPNDVEPANRDKNPADYFEP